MQVAKVEKRDTHVYLDFSLIEISFLKGLLEIAQIEYDSKENPMMHQAATWLNDEFFPLLKEINERLQEE